MTDVLEVTALGRFSIYSFLSKKACRKCKKGVIKVLNALVLLTQQCHDLQYHVISLNQINCGVRSGLDIPVVCETRGHEEAILWPKK